MLALKDMIFVTHTDTTIGFVSQNADKLTDIKKRPPSKQYITTVNSLATLKKFTRIPNIHKSRLRRADKTTFIINSKHSYRIVKNSKHLLLLDRLEWSYSTSANLSGEEYDEKFALSYADILVSFPKYKDTDPSKIYKLGKSKLIKLR